GGRRREGPPGRGGRLPAVGLGDLLDRDGRLAGRALGEVLEQRRELLPPGLEVVRAVRGGPGDVPGRPGDGAEVRGVPVDPVADAEQAGALRLEGVRREDRLLRLGEPGEVARPGRARAGEGREAVGDDDGEVEVLAVLRDLVDAAVPVGAASGRVAVDAAADR